MENGNIQNEHKTNNAAYQPFIKPEPIQKVELKDEDFNLDACRAALESGAIKELLELMVLQQQHLYKKVAPIPEMKLQLDQIFSVTVTSTIYTFVDRNDEYIKIGWSENFESDRKKIHQKNNLEFVASCSGVKARETQLKNTFKASGIKARRGTQEEFRLNKKNIELMMGLGWPLGEDPFSLLRPKQFSLGLPQSST